MDNYLTPLSPFLSPPVPKAMMLMFIEWYNGLKRAYSLLIWVLPLSLCVPEHQDWVFIHLNAPAWHFALFNLPGGFHCS